MVIEFYLTPQLIPLNWLKFEILMIEVQIQLPNQVSVIILV